MEFAGRAALQSDWAPSRANQRQMAAGMQCMAGSLQHLQRPYHRYAATLRAGQCFPAQINNTIMVAAASLSRIVMNNDHH